MSKKAAPDAISRTSRRTATSVIANVTDAGSATMSGWMAEAEPEKITAATTSNGCTVAVL